MSDETIPDEKLDVPVASSEPTLRTRSQKDITAAMLEREKQVRNVLKGSGAPQEDEKND